MDDTGQSSVPPQIPPQPDVPAQPAVLPPQHSRAKIAALIGLALVALFVLARLFGGLGFLVPQDGYQEIYRLVNEKISQHGAIVVHLPVGISKAEALERVSFEPEVKGEWIDSKMKDAVVYKPSAELTLGTHYDVSLTTDDGTISADFLVDEDPKVQTILPSADAEAELGTPITIIFNRPMVPLTTLSELEKSDVPVSISPATPGKWKWITTRTLQFIPTRSLAGSAHYTVTVGSGLTSTDGLAVPGMTHTFTTKALRLDRTTADVAGTIVYSDPIQLFFNQPVDLEKTTMDIRVTSGSSGTPVPIAVSYGTKEVWDDTARAYKTVEDRSILDVLPKNTLNGHTNVWEFATAYTLELKSAYAPGGDIPLDAGRTISVQTTEVLKEVKMDSENTELASEALFDPSGTAEYSFYEDIDLAKSSIRAKGLTKTEYGKKCEDADRPYSETCTKVDDRSVLVLHFDPSQYARGEMVAVSFDRLVNADGFQVNADPIVRHLTVYPELQITKTVPSGGRGASIKDLVLCSNVPLKPQTGAQFTKAFSASNYMVFGRWDLPYLQGDSSWEKDPPCAPGDFVNRIHYGLLPLSQYAIRGSVEDVFGQKASLSLSIFTEAAPRFYLRFQNLQKIYNMTTPQKTKLTFATENFDYVDAYICKVAPDTMLRILAAEPRDTTTEADSSLGCENAKFARIPLKKDQWVNQFFQLDIKDYFPDPRGQYVLSFGHPQFTDEQGRLVHARTYVSVTDLAVTANRVKWTSYDYLPDVPNLTPSDTRGSVYWIARIGDLSPVQGASISIYSYTKAYAHDVPPVLSRSGTTNSQGLAEFPLIADVAGATVTAGSDTAVLSSWADTLSQGSWASAYQDEKAYIYTDRPIYRPGQEVHLKGLYRVDFDGAFGIFRERDVEVKVMDSKWNAILDQRLPVSAYGTFSTTFTLPDDAPLGSYYIQARNNGASFDVQEYKGAAFETTVTTQKDEFLAGETADVAISAKYYFGVPLDGGSLDYSATSQDYYFDRYTDDYFSFGRSWYECYDCGYGDTYIRSGKATLNADGTARISVPLDFASYYKGADADTSKIFVVHGTIHDKQGKSVSFEKSFIVHRAALYLGVKADPAFVAAKEPFTVRVKTADTEGKPRAKSGITVTISRVSWESSKRQEVDGGFYDRPQRVLTKVADKYVATNGSGDATASVSVDEPGEYEIDASTADGGNTVKAASYLYAYGPGTVSVRPTNNATLDMTVEKRQVKAGERAKFIIQNPFPRGKALVAIERGRIFSYEVIDLAQSVYEYEFPVTEDYAPNVFASVILLSPDPAVKFGQVEFDVDRKAKELSVDVRADKQSYLPGEKVNLTVTTRDPAGKPVPAEVSVAVADVSVLALKGNPKKDPLLFFYNGFPLAVTAETNIKNLLEETPIPTGTKGGDGGSPADLAAKKRGEFKDTAYWQAQVITAQDGTAHVSFTLPDNLTKWQVESLGITKDTRVGVNYTEIVAQKDLMAVPLSPRFVIPGDEVSLGAQVFNQTGATQTIDISLASPSLELTGASKVSKTLKAGEMQAVYFPVRVPLSKASGSHMFTITAKAAGHEDTVETTIPITRNETYESTATAGSTKDALAKEYLYVPGSVLDDRGGLTIKTSATLAGYLSDALAYLFEYPYGCSEQLASKLSAIAIGKRAFSVPNTGASLPKVTFDGKQYSVDEAVTIGIAQLYDNQAADGGFSYYKGLRSDPYLTMSVVGSLMDLRAAGYPVRAQVIASASQYLYKQALYAQGPEARLVNDTDGLILAAYTLSRSDPGNGSYGTLLNKVTTRTSKAYLSDKASSESLAYLAVIAARGGVSQGLKASIFGALLNRIQIDSRGAYLETNRDANNWYHYETPQKDTALALKAIVADKREFEETPNLIRWLIKSRAKDGSWGSTNTTVAALDALADYLAWKKETQSSFTLTTLLDSEEVESTTFAAKNIFETMSKFLPITSIAKDKLHAVSFEKENKNDMPNAFYYDLSLKYYLPAAKIAPRDEGIALQRALYSLTDTKEEHPLSSAKVGEVVKGVLTIITPKERHFLSVEDYIPAGFELVNFDLATEDEETITNPGVGEGEQAEPKRLAKSAPQSGFLSGLGTRLMAALGVSVSDVGLDNGIVYQTLTPSFKELRDDRLFLFSENVAPGAYRYVYYLRATTPGTFSHLPAIASEMYFPENFGRTGGEEFQVTE